MDAWSSRLDELGIPHKVDLATIGWIVVFHDPDGLEIHLYSRERQGKDLGDQANGGGAI